MLSSLILIVVLHLSLSSTCKANFKTQPFIHNTYTVEELTCPNNKGKKSDGIYCRYRDLGPYPQELWAQLISAQCYNFANNEWFREGLRLRLQCKKVDETNLCHFQTKVNNETIDFDYRNDRHMDIIRNTFKKPLYFQKFYDCCLAAVDCCEKVLVNEDICPTDEYPCPALWDGWACIPRAQADTTTYVDCPPYVTSSEEPECVMQGSKICTAEGTWITKTDYTTCSPLDIYKKRHLFHTYVLYVATGLIVPSVVIFASLPRLVTKTRVALHLNLIATILLKNIIVLLSKNLVILDSLLPANETNNVLRKSELPCKILAFVENVVKNAIFTSMFVDGFYLHKMLVRSMSKDPNKYLLIGVLIVFSLLPSLIWMALMWSRGLEQCWMVNDAWFEWIPDGYKYLILVINTILLFDIIRVLAFKLKKRNVRANIKATLKATIFLLPLFGLPLLVTSQKEIFDTTDCTWSDIYYYLTYVVEGLQGVLVAVVFCYLNKEVQNELRNRFRKWNVQIREMSGWYSSNDDAGRRTTAFTNVPRESQAVT